MMSASRPRLPILWETRLAPSAVLSRLGRPLLVDWAEQLRPLNVWMSPVALKVNRCSTGQPHFLAECKMVLCDGEQAGLAEEVWGCGTHTSPHKCTI